MTALYCSLTRTYKYYCVYWLYSSLTRPLRLNIISNVLVVLAKVADLRVVPHARVEGASRRRRGPGHPVRVVEPATRWRGWWRLLRPGKTITVCLLYTSDAADE